jgi:DNA helicase HerA-like ATPase
MAEGLPIAKGKQHHALLPRLANRHGLIAGATGTGKTVNLRVIAEHFSAISVPVFMADVKGDLSGIARPRVDNPKIAERVERIGVEDFRFTGYPTVFWDLYGEQGQSVCTTISDMGPLLLARLLNLNETQSEVLGSIFGSTTTRRRR